jgi:adenylyltransferase/sulfurtransferase
MLKPSQIERYSRQLLLPEIGAAGQEKMAAGRVLIIGAGGLGSPAALYLAGAGIGTLGMVDSDAVDISNLHRQLLHTLLDVGRSKVDSAEEGLRLVNPDVEVVPYPVRLTAANAEELIAAYDFILDCTDNFDSKFLIADACHFAGKPYSHAGVRGFTGQTMTVLPGQTTCYRCIFREPPPPGAVPSCSEAGILGPVAGVIGSIQAIEAVKFLLGKGELLTDRWLTVDALSMNMRVTPKKRNANCPLCGKNPCITELRDAEAEEAGGGCCCGGGTCCPERQG